MGIRINFKTTYLRLPQNCLWAPLTRKQIDACQNYHWPDR